MSILIEVVLNLSNVTKLSPGQSAGNNTLVIGTSETIRKNIENSVELSVSSENIKLISKHVTTHRKLLTDEEFGHYLAGLIDGDGRLGYGKVTKIVNKNAVMITITSPEAIGKVINLINEDVHLNTNSNINNSWLAGFIDSDGSFQVKLIDRVRLYVQIDQKTRYRKIKDTYYYSSTSFGSARNFIKYLDSYHLLSSKQCYIFVQSKKHLTPEGQNKIRKLKLSMNSYSKETLYLST
ncbi:homing endonuclease [Tuber indicum]|nr:homing endonuclease [Tuber indicum]